MKLKLKQLAKEFECPIRNGRMVIDIAGARLEIDKDLKVYLVTPDQEVEYGVLDPNNAVKELKQLYSTAVRHVTNYIL